jgi:hypothetical protein
MSILNPVPVQPDEQVILMNKARYIKQAPLRLAENMLEEWETSFDALWREEGKFTPAQRLEAIGTDAEELFELNSQFVTFMVSQLTGKRNDLVQRIQEKVATIPAYTVNNDGTVTLD